MPKLAANVEVNNAVVQKMMQDTRFLQQFPFLRKIKQAGLRARKRGCGCGRKTRPGPPKPDLELAKRRLANMGPGQKVKLKRLLEAKQVSIPYRRTAGGKAVRVIR